MNWSTNFRSFQFNVKMAPFFFKHMNSILSVFIYTPMPIAACSKLYNRDLVTSCLMRLFFLLDLLTFVVFNLSRL